MDNNSLAIGIVIGIVIGLVMILLIDVINRPTCYSQQESLHILINQAARWSTASFHDNNPLIAVLHANYGTGYLWAAKEIATEEEIERVTNINMKKFKKEILNAQRYATLKAIKQCPKFSNQFDYLAKIGGEGT